MTDYAAPIALVVLTAALVGFGGTAIVLGATQPADGGLGSETFAQNEVDADRIVLDVDLAEDGSASWRVAYRVELRTDNETAAFEDLRADITANASTYTSAFRERMERTAGVAENATGRTMSVRDVAVSADTEAVQGYGTVAYTFQWTNFATVDGDRVRAGDALAGFFLERDSRLVVSWPEGYEATTLSPDPDDRRDSSATWTGPLEFGSEGPQFVVEPTGGLSTVLIAVAAVVVVGLSGGLWLFVRRRDEAGEEPDAEGTPEYGAEATEPEPEDGGTASPREELLSNEERVLRLLEERDGRAKQQAVKGEFDWTDAKTSQVVNSLKDEGKVDVFRLGRENVIVLPEESDL